MAEGCGAEVYDSADEYNRDDRIEAYYCGWGAREMAERIVELEDELGADVDGVCTGMYADVAEARAEVERLQDVVRNLEGDCVRLSEELGDVREANAGLARDLRDAAHWEGVVDRMRDGIARLTSERDRYRLAWLSAWRRAADEHVFGMEALALRDAEIARLRAELEEVRKSTHGPASHPPAITT
ncbi:hypothetical protein J7I94_19230 [Streptomyces sp. ISL-12]|uniref:hypothetical protein n=1 Tax=Streptomyces sp. ISL-12 TaxID=2819177 RepID=UPI001BE91BD1|nr:hypothetical protein [Streptomyces sp. ISL-12]MBT2412668.1 hypothetical protein [Streptomyces sp. ISL-12]